MKIFAFLCAALFPAFAHAALEIGELFKTALVEQKDAYLDWAFMSRNGSPVAWETSGVRSYSRNGRVVLAVNKFVPEVLKKTVQSGDWAIDIKGDKFGVKTVHITTDSCFGEAGISKKCIQNLSQFPKSLQFSGVTTELVCKFGPGDYQSEVYRIKVPNYPPAYIHSVVHGGSGGSFMDMTLIFKASNAGTELEHATAICSLLFTRTQSGQSYVASDYQFLLAE